MSVERSILLQGIWKYNDTEIVRVSNTFSLSDEQREIVKQAWENKPSDAQDLPLWRYEGYALDNRNLQIKVSLCSYKWHFILRNYIYKRQSDYPNPISATSLMHTSDNKLVLGIRKGSDQGNRLHTVGGGFIDPIPKYTPGQNLNSLIPENPFTTSAREIREETSVRNSDFSIADFSLLGFAWGNNHDTTCVVHAPVNVISDKITINAPEHSELIFVDLEDSALKFIMSNGYLENRVNTPATDHCILALRLFFEKEMQKKHPNFN